MRHIASCTNTHTNSNVQCTAVFIAHQCTGCSINLTRHKCGKYMLIISRQIIRCTGVKFYVNKHKLTRRLDTLISGGTILILHKLHHNALVSTKDLWNTLYIALNVLLLCQAYECISTAFNSAVESVTPGVINKYVNEFLRDLNQLLKYMNKKRKCLTVYFKMVCAF